jgi:hypothetical protein
LDQVENPLLAKRFRGEPLRFVIAADVIFDLMRQGMEYGWRAGHTAAMQLFDAIAADIEKKTPDSKAYISPVTVPLVYHAMGTLNPGVNKHALLDLFRLVNVVQLGNIDYAEGLGFSGFDYVDAMEFVTCRVIGARFLVTRRMYGKKKLPVQSREAGEVLPLLRP